MFTLCCGAAFVLVADARGQDALGPRGKPVLDRPTQQSLALIDDTHLWRNDARRPLQRFQIVQAADKSLLLDTATGDTWLLIVTEEGQGTTAKWLPIIRPPILPMPDSPQPAPEATRQNRPADGADFNGDDDIDPFGAPQLTPTQKRAKGRASEPRRTVAPE
jgi:hypothetical protein